MRLITLFFCLIPLLGWSQIGGQSGYQSLNLSPNPRAAALGGTVVSLADGDISQFFQNPAVLDSVADRSVFTHVNPYFADVNIFSAAYAFQAGRAGLFSAGIHYINYGSFNLTDESGNALGTFQARDYAIYIGKAQQLGPFTLGANLKLAHSSIESYGSTALMMDLGGIFRIQKNWTVAMVFRNVGVRLSDYAGLVQPNIPFDVSIGTSFKPEYMPFRFTLTTANLVDENANLSSANVGRSSEGVDRIMRRINVGAELLLSKNVNLLIGYSHKRKQDLRLEQGGGGSGISYGLMIRVKQLELRFSRATFHAAGGSSFISLQTNLNDFKKIL